MAQTLGRELVDLGLASHLANQLNGHLRQVQQVLQHTQEGLLINYRYFDQPKLLRFRML